MWLCPRAAALAPLLRGLHSPPVGRGQPSGVCAATAGGVLRAVGAQGSSTPYRSRGSQAVCVLHSEVCHASLPPVIIHSHPECSTFLPDLCLVSAVEREKGCPKKCDTGRPFPVHTRLSGKLGWERVLEFDSVVFGTSEASAGCWVGGCSAPPATALRHVWVCTLLSP